MSLTPGTRLGTYEITSALGAGGMGEVYRARDTKLNRDVAIKVLPDLFAADHDRIARLEREAQSLAAMNHPNIAQVYAVIEEPPALAMELVAGEDLSQRIARGPIPVAEALPIARQVAEALEAAHERGIVHRDLKPANIKVREDGTVKVLDFGLAKAVDRSVVAQGFSPGSGDHNSPTFTSPAMTGMGVILGTAAYMSPEQAKGKAVDKRADIWAFGAVLFEMLTGLSAFGGDSMTEVLGAVVLKDPDWSLLPSDTPAHVRHILRRCLEKDPKRRVRDIADVAYELDAPHAPQSAAPVANRRAWIGGALLFVLGAAVATAAVLWVRAASDRSSQGARHFAVSGLSTLLFDPFQTLAITPDGNILAFRGRGADGVERIYLRDFRSLELRGLSGTEGGRMPFFSPDGRWVGFFAANSLKKVALAGGAAQTIAAATGPAGGAWLDDGTIVFVGDPASGLKRVSSSGGTPETLIEGSDGTRNTLAAPSPLPGSKAVLFLKREGATFDAAVLSLEDKQVRVLARDAYSLMWVPTGHILFHQEDSILARQFDVRTLSASGDAFPVAQGVGNRLSYQSRLFTVAGDGTLVYVPAAGPGEAGWSIVSLDREGKRTSLVALERAADIPRLSPDGRYVAFRTPAPNCDIWVRDLARGTTVRVTRDGDNHGVVWRPDGTIVTARISPAVTDIVSIPADGSGAPKTLYTMRAAVLAFPTSWGPPDVVLVQDRFREDGGTDIATVSGQTGEQRPLLNGPSDEYGGVLSPDGKLVAYVSNESGRDEVYVRAMSGVGPRTLVSNNGGIEPVWSRKGDELFYRNGRDLLAVSIQGDPGASLTPRVLFSGDYPVGTVAANYDVSADGKRFLMVQGRQWPEGQVIVVLNWFSELRGRQQ